MSTEGGVKRPIQHEVNLSVVWCLENLHRVLYYPYTAHTVHAITNLLCFSSVKHKTVLYYKGSSAV